MKRLAKPVAPKISTVLTNVCCTSVSATPSKVGLPADPDIQACIDRAQPAFDAFQLKMVTYDVVSGTRKGQTEMLGDSIS